MNAPMQAAPVDFERQRAVSVALRRFMPENSVLFEREDVTPYECDGLSAYRQVPMVVALPENEQQICEILETCHAMRVPVVARGAGTGLSGGALPLGNGVLLSLAKLMKIVDIDPVARTARVQPGVRNLAISEAVASHGLYYAPDPSSQIACSIGGNIAENSGGVHCLKYGLTVHNILKLRVATIEGDMIE
ncbi:MAG: FAD-binding protein, partial [Betaproteobacteria bacterium]|nr:FAD-binding protein [Betaproteobacteria bacterium]